MPDLNFRPKTYWPNGETGEEAEIVVIESQSTLGDVVVLTARREEGAIAYGVVDDHEMAWSIPRGTSAEPLTLGELVELLEGAHPVGDPDHRGLMPGWRQFNLMEPADAPDLVDFLRVTSPFYPELEQLDRERATQWAEQVQRDVG